MATNLWALPTTGNLSYDDYGRALDAWMEAHPYIGSEVQQYQPGAQELVNGSIDSITDVNPEHSAWDWKQRQEFFGQLTPDQRAEYDRLMQERDSKLKRNGMLGALAAFGGIAGAGMLGAGMLGGASAPVGLSGYYTGLGGAEGAGTAAFIPGVDSALASSQLGLSGLGSMGIPSAVDLGSLGGVMSTGAAGAATTAAGASPWETFLKGLTKDAAGKAGGSLLSQLISAGGNAYMGNKQAGQYNDVINQINQLYAPDSPYAQQMQQALARKDAAAGRNSQYGSRAVELAAALTKAKSDALTSPGFGNLLGQRGTNQNSIVNGFLAALGSGPGQDLISRAGSGIGNYLSKFFGSSGDSYSPTSPNNGFNNDWMMAYAPGG